MQLPPASNHDKGNHEPTLIYKNKNKTNLEDVSRQLHAGIMNTLFNPSGLVNAPVNADDCAKSISVKRQSNRSHENKAQAGHPNKK